MFTLTNYSRSFYLFINFEHPPYKDKRHEFLFYLNVNSISLSRALHFFFPVVLITSPWCWKGNWVTRIYRRTGYFPHVQADGVWIIKKIVYPYFAPNLPGKCYRRVRKWALDITPTVSAKRLHFLLNFITKVTLKVQRRFT